MKAINLTEDQAVMTIHALQTEISALSIDITTIQDAILERPDRHITDEEAEQIEECKARSFALGEIVDIISKSF